MRKPLIVANWKLNKNRAEAREYAGSLLRQLPQAHPLGPEIAIAPPFTCLESLAALLQGSQLKLAAQNVCSESSGAFTGEVSAPMLKEVGCQYCIVGHSERRALYGETSQTVATKARAVFEAGLRPIVCVGESLDAREADETQEVIGNQLEQSLPEAGAPGIAELVVAYEPVWAIGTGLTATPEQAQTVHAFIRARLAERFGEDSGRIRIQYGGSVDPSNVSALLAETDIDGALVGGASLDPMSFAKIISHAITENNPS